MMIRCRLPAFAFWAVLSPIIAAGLWGMTPANASKMDLQDLYQEAETQPDIEVTIGKGMVFPLEGKVSDVMIANASIAEITPLKSGQLYVVGLQAGDTNIITVDGQGEVLGKYEVHVKYDTLAIQSLVERLFPEEDVTIEAIHDQILIHGQASTAERASKIANLVGHYVSDLQDESNQSVDELISNHLTVPGAQQVMLRVRIAEVSRTILKELGVETSINDPTEGAAFNLFNLNPPESVDSGVNSSLSSLITSPQTGLTEDPFAALSLLGDTGIGGIGFVNILLNMLEQENMANVLAEPNLTAISGEQAGFLAGGEFPVPVGRDQTGNVIVEFQPFGVSLNFVPKVMSKDRISLQLDTEVSSLDFESAVTLASINVPGIDIRRANTTVELPSGGSMMIGGLLQSENIKGLSGLPGAKNAPVIGDLIKSDSFQRNETELVVIVTAYLVEPYADKEQAVPIKRERNDMLSRTFKANIRRIYGAKLEGAFSRDQGKALYGYLIN